MSIAYRLENISFGYGSRTVLNIPELEIEAGRITALVGPNGSGKTTLLNMLSFIEIPGKGEISFFNEKVKDGDVLAFRRRVGLLLQNPYLFHSSVISNVEAGLKIRGISPHERHSISADALAKVGLFGFEGRKATSLSGGEAQRVALARVLALQPQVILLDEPATYMDAESERRTEEVILELNREKGVTVIFTTQDILRAQALADRVLSIFRGSIVSASLVNLFRGKVSEDGKQFHTEKIVIFISGGSGNETHISVDPSDIVLSKESLHSSMRNSFKGRIVAIFEENGKVRIEVEAGERFQSLITRDSLKEMGLHIGDDVWLSFKSTAVKVF
ncbi:MAG: ATP-binding cassette domain-containing protein [Candidatus Schekmanbacteria bacterium]|nr:ATP-binding cassette domain-containing protein [Candidatus Schekmanbacteria bacterium]